MKINQDTLRTLRLQSGWTQQHLADAAGLSLRTVQRVEREGAAAQETVLALAAALQTTTEALTQVHLVGRTLVSDPRLLVLIMLLSMAVGAGVGAGLAVSFL